MTLLEFDIDADGVALITLNDPDRPMNVVSPEWIEEMLAIIEQVADRRDILGAIICSAKPAFMAGADLKGILEMMERGISEHEAVDFSHHATAMHRRLETCGKPFVAAINGLALGGGFELCLACHYRLVANDAKIMLGLPEVTVGLIPGSGGTQRLPRLIGIDKAIPLIVEGKTVGPAQALELGMVDAVAEPAELLNAAREWIRSAPVPLQIWDQKGDQLAQGAGSHSSEQTTRYSLELARIVSRTHHNYPAPIANLDVIFEGATMPFDEALALESKRFAQLLTGSVARNIIRTNFVNKGLAGKLVHRPPGIPRRQVQKLGVLGAGLMGAGIAHVAAAAGIEVVLFDRTEELAKTGKLHTEKLLDKAVLGSRKTPKQAEDLLARLQPSCDFADLSACELIVEAVFEDRAVKADVTRKTEAVIAQSAIFASNTSTLPISGLAEASVRPEQFIGLHFFSPVERMSLVEVICAKKISDATLANALDFVRQLRMTPIVVNDSRGFYTSRVFRTFIDEGMTMLDEGVEPASIENAALFAGMPIGPLALLDEVTIALPWKIVKQSIEDLGDSYQLPCSYRVMELMVEDLKRTGRRTGGGFYEYPREGGKQLWRGLKEHFPLATQQASIDELKKRLLYVQAIESSRCLEEGVLRHPADADLGSVMGWGFPAYTGGTLSMIDTIGLEQFVSECDLLARRHGPRFLPSASLRERALHGESFLGGGPQRPPAA